MGAKGCYGTYLSVEGNSVGYYRIKSSLLSILQIRRKL